jgi:hypothetical protein
MPASRSSRPASNPGRGGTRTGRLAPSLPRSGSFRSAWTPGTPSRAHHAPGSTTPGPHRGWAGSASSAVSGVAVIAEGPALGACSVTTASSSPSATTGPPDIPDHSEPPSSVCQGGSGRGAVLTSTVSSPPASPDSTGT